MKPNIQESLFDYTLQLGDNALILGNRLSEWCGHGPVLEQDIAMTNIALDLIGQARNWLQYAGKVEGKGRTEDDLAYLRDVFDFKNVLLVEQPNGHWGQTMLRQFLFDSYNYYLHQALCESKDNNIADIAQKALKEITYHLRFSSEWVIRLGDGTDESHQKMQKSLEDIWMYSGELLTMSAVENDLLKEGIAVDLALIRPKVQEKIDSVLQEATLQKPTSTWMQSGGKIGHHSEHLGFILAEMQYLPRAYPGTTW